ncbi:hypothetical protein D477_015072 [Arthrobacter crystallopoietes BAB-32]|uniref:DUF2254 domain-containing protein n=1 Tax=Arthrobacter crystallopoietes BAB-32 TaxID=1246476 RepID=N1V075_9MICC|nr:DUF2254 domain-containing protein [Arthrobacter crystallopoietes]EMY33429.1 hypothetical protein D477_015072 [Arthrobacter crystallopoietes BAB-32]
MNRRGQRLKDALRTQLWPVPALAVVLAVVLGAVLPPLDAALDGHMPAALAAWLFGGGPEAARSVLQAVSGSLITVTSLTFSLTVVTLQLASSQFSPRLLRTFSRDRVVHLTLALFLATFAYALTVLRSIRTGEDDGGAFVPEIAVTVAFVLAVASVMGLVVFLAHLARELRVETMMHRVHAEAVETADVVFPPDAPGQPELLEPPELPGPPAATAVVEAEASGFLTAVDEAALLEAARSAGAVVRIDREPGTSLIRGVPFASVWGLEPGGPPEGEVLARLGKEINAAVTVGYERTSVQDVGFGFRQLADVASRALSPGINDPTTAAHALGHLSSLLCRLVERAPGPRAVTDPEGRVRVILALPQLAGLLDLALCQPRLYGSKDPVVMARMLQLLCEVSWLDHVGRYRPVLSAQLAQLRQAMDAADYSDADRRSLEQLACETAARPRDSAQ